jgi:hypothetical protein
MENSYRNTTYDEQYNSSTALRQTSSTAMTTSTASRLSKPRSFVKEAEGLSYKHAINNYVGTFECDHTFSVWTFSKDLRTSNIRVSMWAFSRDPAAEKARCGMRILENLESEGEARWRVVALRRAI